MTGSWSRDLLESDRRYFEAGADVLPVPAAAIAVLRGAESLAAGCVVQRIDAEKAGERPEAWIAELEDRLRGLSCPRARLYLDAPNARLEAALEHHGYTSRVEIGFARGAGRNGGAGAGRLELVSAEDERGWTARRDLLRRSRRSPDGHASDADLWIEMEKRRHRAGYMRPFLIEAGGEVVGAVSSAPCGSVLRIKNLAVDPERRRRGIATAVAVLFAGLAEDEGFEATGCFALNGEPGIVLYPRAGYREVVRQTEWVRDLDGASERVNARSDPLEPRAIATYRRDGHVVVSGLFDARDVRAWTDECDRLWASVPSDRSNPRVQWRAVTAGGEIADRIDPVLDISPVYDALARDPRILAAAGSLLGEPATPFKAKLITKRPGTAGYGLHQDYPYWEMLGLPADAYVNALVAFDPFDSASGTPEFFPGLHHGKLPAPPGSPLDADESLLEERHGLFLELAPGDFVLFHSLTPHRSGPNLGTHSRRGLFLTYVPSRYPDLNDRYEQTRLDRKR